MEFHQIQPRWPATYQRIMPSAKSVKTICSCCKLAEASLKINVPSKTQTQLNGTSNRKPASETCRLHLLIGKCAPTD